MRALPGVPPAQGCLDFRVGCLRLCDSVDVFCCRDVTGLANRLEQSPLAKGRCFNVLHNNKHLRAIVQHVSVLVLPFHNYAMFKKVAASNVIL